MSAAGANPCLGVERWNPKARDRYVTDQEYQQRFDLAGERGRRDVQIAMELAYRCRLREGEICRLRDTAEFITSGGLLAKHSKGSKTQIIEWSPRLKEAIMQARGIRRKTPTMCLLVSSASGIPLSQRALQGAWNELRKIAIERGHAADWHFHDIKAKGVSDFEGDKHKASGHRSVKMTEVYDRKPTYERVASTR